MRLRPPARGDPGWPRLQIENRAYQSRRGAGAPTWSGWRRGADLSDAAKCCSPSTAAHLPLCRAFRKLHLEVAVRQDGLQVRALGPATWNPFLCADLHPSHVCKQQRWHSGRLMPC